MITEIGPHKVQHSDIMNGVEKLMGDDKIDFVYSDPPWGQGNLRYWQTINMRNDGVERNNIEYDGFLHQFFSILKRYIKDVAVIEYGEKWREDIVAIVKSYGFHHHGACTSLYKAGSKLLPVDIHLISKSGSHTLTETFADRCYKLRGQALVNMAFEHYLPSSAKMVLDPMCGMGYTAQATVDNGLIFRGNELNAARLEKTKDRLRKSVE